MKQLPVNVTAYKRTATFTEKSIPAELLKSHNTKAGVWGKIVILELNLWFKSATNWLPLRKKYDAQ